MRNLISVPFGSTFRDKGFGLLATAVVAAVIGVDDDGVEVVVVSNRLSSSPTAALSGGNGRDGSSSSSGDTLMDERVPPVRLDDESTDGSNSMTLPGVISPAISAITSPSTNPSDGIRNHRPLR